MTLCTLPLSALSRFSGACVLLTTPPLALPSRPLCSGSPRLRWVLGHIGARLLSTLFPSRFPPTWASLLALRPRHSTGGSPEKSILVSTVPFVTGSLPWSLTYMASLSTLSLTTSSLSGRTLCTPSTCLPLPFVFGVLRAGAMTLPPQAVPLVIGRVPPPAPFAMTRTAPSCITFPLVLPTTMPELPGHIPAASLRRTFPRLHGTAGCSTQLTNRIRRRQSGPTFALLGSSANDSNHLPGDASLFSHSFPHLPAILLCSLQPVSLRSLARISASVAVLSASTIGSSLALRSFARCELSLSVFTLAMFSLPMAVRSMACTSASLSVFIFARFGASLSVRSFARFFAVSVWWHEFGSSLYLIDMLILASSLSLRSFARLGASVAVLSDTHLGGSLSLRSFSRLGSSLSVWSIPRFGSHLGSSLSQRSLRNLALSFEELSRPGAVISVPGFSLALRRSVDDGSRVCPCEVHHVWGRRFLWWKKCLLARLFHCVWALLCLCCHSRISERRFRCVALPTFRWHCIDASVVVLSVSTADFSLALRCELSLSVFTLATFSLPMAFSSMACTSTSLSVFICARFDKKQFVTFAAVKNPEAI